MHIVNVLTIDWDYFFLAPLAMRDEVFPRITDGKVGAIPDNSLWEEVDKSLIDDPTYLIDRVKIDNLMSEIRTMPRFKGFFLSENHGAMYEIMNQIIECEGENYVDYKITNIDFHHDYYFTNGNTPCCDNWLRLVNEQHDIAAIKWCMREDSVTTSFGEHIFDTTPIKIIQFYDILQRLELGMYNYIHLCRSDLYSPPVADYEFNALAEKLEEKSLASRKFGELEDRSRLMI